MHTNTHPEPDERERRDSAATPTTPPPAAEPGSVREALMRARDEDSLSNNQLAQRLGCSPSVISQWFNGDKYPGDKARLERRAADFLRSRERRRLHGVPLVESDATRVVKGALELIRRTNDVGVIYGDAGVGKTSGIVLYRDENTTCLTITLARWARTAEAIERLVFGEIEHGAWKGNTPRSEFIVQRLRGSCRLLIVDNAHKATAAALEWLFDLHDETGIPIALVGNEEVLRPIEANDQRFSRVGLKQPVTAGKTRKLVAHLVNHLAPQLAGKVEDLLDQVADHHGRIRAVGKQTSLAGMLSEAGNMDPIAAVKAAHQRLVRHYELA